MTVIWLIAFLGLLLVEFITVGLVSIWFAVGALFALIVSFFTDSILFQATTFVVVSVIALIVTKPLIKKFKLSETEPTNSDRVIGKTAEVIKTITPDEYGEVKIFGTIWLAASKQKLVEGTKVVVEKIDGSKLIVKKEGE